MAEEIKAEAPVEPSLDDLLAQYIAGEEAGSAPDRQELLKHHPHLADELRQFFANRDEMQRLAQPLRGDAAVPRGSHSLGKLRYFGDYELLEEVAAGGMGIVYKARQLSLNRIVAVKMILKGTLAREDDVKRFRTEAEAAANLQHPAIVAIHEVGLHEGQHYFSMDYVDGHSLAALPREQPLSAHQAAEYIRDAAEAVHFAHQQGTLHRDLKPSNILIDQQRRVRITDFGLARRIGSGSDLTLTGQVLGTPGYMPPEQASGKRSLVAAASDIYSLGAVLYELLAGRPPFRGESPAETLRQVETMDPISPRLLNPAVPRDLETICLKCLEKEPHKRYGTGELLAEDLENWLAGRPILARRTGVLGRAWKWTKRKPTAAALMAVCALAVITFVTGLVVSNRLILLKERQTKAAYELLSERERMITEANENLRRKEAETATANQLLANSLESEKVVQSQLTATNASLRSAIDQAQRASYGRSVNLAYQHLIANDINQADAILDECGPDQLRGWEWRYLKQQVQPSGLFSIRGNLGNGATAPFSPDGRCLAVLLDDGTIRLIDWASGVDRAILRGHGRSVARLVISPDGGRIAAEGMSLSAYYRNQISVWDTGTGQLLWTGALSAKGLAFSPDGRWLAAAVALGGKQQEYRIEILDADSGRPLRTFPVRRGAPRDLAISPDGKLVATAGSNEAFGVWDSTTGEAVIAPLRTETAGSVALSTDGKWLATAGTDGVIRIRDLNSRAVERVIHAHAEQIHSLSFHPNSRWLASASNDRSVKVWEISSGKELYAVRHPTLGFCAAAFSPDGEYLVTATWGTGEFRSSFVSVTWDSGITAGEIRVWSASSGPTPRTLEGHRRSAWGVAYSPTGALIATSGEDKAIVIWDAATGKRRQTLHGHEDSVCGLAFESGGSVLASASRDKTVRLWDLTDGTEIKVLRGHGFPTYAVAFSSDGKTLASTDHQGTVNLWDWPSGVETRSWQAHKGITTAATFSRDGKSLVTGGADKRVRRWDVSTGNQIGKDLQHSGPISQVVFAPNGFHLGVVGTNGDLYCSYGVVNTPQGLLDRHRERRDGFLQVWDLNREEIALPISDQPHFVYGIAFAPDGSRIVGSTDRGLRIWDASSGQELLTMAVGRGLTHGVAFSPDGQTIAVTDAGGNLSLASADLRSHDLWRDLASRRRDEGRLMINTRDEKGAAAALDEALQLRKQVAAVEGSYPIYQTELAVGYEDLAGFHRQFKRWEQAEDSLRRAIDIRRELASKSPNNDAFKETLAWSLINHSFSGPPDAKREAEQACREGVRLLGEVYEARANAPAQLVNLAAAQVRLARLQRRGEADAAVKTYRDAVELLSGLVSQDPGRMTISAELIATRAELAQYLKQLGKRQEGLEIQRITVAESERLGQEAPWSHAYRYGLARHASALAQFLFEASQNEEAEATELKAGTVLKNLVTDEPNTVTYRQELGRHQMRIAARYKADRRFDLAEAAFQAAVSQFEYVVALPPASPPHQQELASAQNQFGIFYFDQQRYDDAQALYDNALKAREKLASQSPSNAVYAVELAGTLCNIGHVVLLGRKESQSAITWYSRAVKALEPLAEKNTQANARPYLFNAYQGRAEAYSKVDRWKEAAADFREALKLQPNNPTAKKRLEDATREWERRAIRRDEPAAFRPPPDTANSRLERHGAFGFPQAQAEILCDQMELRVSAWNDAEHLYVQAIVWADGDDALGETSDGRPIGDHSNLILDVDANQEATPRVDRAYSLNPWPHLPGLRYDVVVTKTSTTRLQADSKGRGAIKYVWVGEGRRVRVDSFVVPLSEIRKTAGETIRLAYYSSSPQPKQTLNSVGYQARGTYYSYSLPKKDYHEMKLSDRPVLLDPKTVPEGREETVPLPKKVIKPLPKVGAVPPEIAAADWINVDAPLTLAQLRGNVVLVEFWATWCGPCLESIPALNNLHEKYSTNGLRILSFTDQSKQGIENFLNDRTIKYAIGTGSELAAEYGVGTIPHAFLIGKDGKLVWHGTAAVQDYEPLVIAALAEK